MMISTVASSDAERGATSKISRQDAVGDRQSAWQREMEREQLQTWLQHPALVGTGGTSQEAAKANTALFPAVGLVRVAATTTGIDESAQAQSRDGATQDDADIAETAEPGEPAIAANDLAPDAAAGASNGTLLKKASFTFSKSVGEGGESAGERLTTAAQGLQQLLKDSGLPPIQLTIGNVAASAMMSTAKQGDTLPASFAIHLDNMEEKENLESLESQKASPDFRVPASSMPLRFHTEANGNVARIWIGADGSVRLNEEKLQQLGSDIQKFLNESGIVLESLTCNGTVVMRGSNRLVESRREEKLHNPTGKAVLLGGESTASKIASLRSLRT
jgi:hypothetical protein